MKKIVLFYIIIQSALLAAQENEKKYIWPLAIYDGISSTFQEFRSNHFHAGIDLRTFQQPPQFKAKRIISQDTHRVNLLDPEGQ